MKPMMKALLISIPVVLMMGLLSACNFQPQGTPTQGIEPGLIYTAAAQTVAAQLTLAAADIRTPQPSQTLAVILPSATLPPPASPTTVPTNTSIPPTPIPPSATPIPVPCDRASFVKDVTYPDDTEVPAGATFDKTWRLKNNGTCTWNSSYSIVFVSGDSMGAAPSAQLTTGVVAPGETIDVTVRLNAPTTVKTYKGFFQLRNGSGLVFGIGLDAKSSFWVKVKVVSPNTPTPTLTPTAAAALQFDFVNRGPNAEWRTVAGALPWGDPTDDSVGMAFAVDNRQLEDGRNYNKALITFPQVVENGMIRGRYPAYTVASGDRFRAMIGVGPNCSNLKWRYQLKYEESGVETLLGEWLDSCDKNLIYLDKDLSSLAGKTVNFVLVVMRESGNTSSDLTYWVYPRIER